ncbi:MAG: phenylalanine--tRNA ligase subunit beta [Clostridiales bacterium]|nr:phenylalanine--tRNA ligase subunit beta [Clostridiales bacterium]
MKAPLIWLKDFTDINVSLKELSQRLTMSGSKVEAIITTGEGLSGVYSGKIISVRDHPDSDHLHIVTVDLGSDELGRDLQIVCGAPNVYEGMICPVATIGSKLPSGIEIKKGKLRGVESFGMCCSIDELGVTPDGYEGADSYGLWDMPSDTPVGADIKDILGLGSAVLEFEIMSDRPDCLSIEGLGREAAVTLGQPFRPVVPVFKGEGTLNTSEIVRVNISDPDKCFRYCCRTIEDIVIGRSPEWVEDRLSQAGISPVNNIVDICNYVCLELGQPVTAFDFDRIAGAHIIVRSAEADEKTVMSDGSETVLDPSDIVIADEEKICEVAGVISCKSSGVSAGTKTVLLESSCFNGDQVRKTARNLGIRSISSVRAGSGLDPEGCIRALDRACELIELTGCGKVSKGVIDVYPVRLPERRIAFVPEWIGSFLGIEADSEYMKNILTDLGCVFDGSDIIPPSYRSDLVSPADIAEEVARFYGYNNIEPTFLSGKQTTLGGRTPEQKTSEKIRDTLVACGFCEAVTYSFESPADMDILLIPDDSPLRDQVRIADSVTGESYVMRTTMLPSMYQIAKRNSDRGVPEARAFELAGVYIPDADPSALPLEKKTLSGFYYSNIASVSGADVFYETKGAVTELASVLGIRSIFFEALTDDPTFHPGRTAAVTVNGKRAGVIGMIHPDIAEKTGCPSKLCFFELDAGLLISSARTERVYKQLPRFPGIARDLALVVPVKTAVGDIIRASRSAGGKYLRDVEFFDVNDDPQDGEDSKSVTLSLVFWADDRTLTQDDVNGPYEKIVEKIEKQFGGRLR